MFRLEAEVSRTRSMALNGILRNSDATLKVLTLSLGILKELIHSRAALSL